MLGGKVRGKPSLRIFAKEKREMGEYTHRKEHHDASVCLALTRQEADALLALLLRAPEVAGGPSGQIEALLFRLLKGLTIPGPDVATAHEEHRIATSEC